VLSLAEAVAFARIAHKDSLGSDVFQTDKKLLGFGEGSSASKLSAPTKHHETRNKLRFERERMKSP